MPEKTPLKLRSQEWFRGPRYYGFSRRAWLPESAAGGPLAAVRTGDEILLDLAPFTPPPPHYARGYGKLFLDHVTQTNLGCDFDFLLARKG